VIDLSGSDLFTTHRLDRITPKLSHGSNGHSTSLNGDLCDLCFAALPSRVANGLKYE